MKVFSIYDSKAEAFLRPFFERTAQTAIRAFAAAVNDPETDFGRYPADYTLFEIARWDEANGQILPMKTARSLGLGVEHLENEDNPQLQVVESNAAS